MGLSLLIPQWGGNNGNKNETETEPRFDSCLTNILHCETSSAPVTVWWGEGGEHTRPQTGSKSLGSLGDDDERELRTQSLVSRRRVRSYNWGFPHFTVSLPSRKTATGPALGPWVHWPT